MAARIAMLLSHFVFFKGDTMESMDIEDSRLVGKMVDIFDGDDPEMTDELMNQFIYISMTEAKEQKDDD